MYIEVEDDDSSITNDNTVDVFLIDIPPTSIQAGDTSPHQNYTGMYSWATIGLQYQLMCGAGFTGPSCNLMSPCSNVDCGRGVCTELDNTLFTCTCEDGFIGDRCEVTDPCYLAPCGSGTCVNLEDTFLCDCEAGFTGRLCEIDINKCANDSCSGRGQCVYRINSRECLCDTGYGGVNCETLVVPSAFIVGTVAVVVIAVLVLVGVVLCILGTRHLRKRELHG